MVDLQKQLSLGGVGGEARRTGTVNDLVWFADHLGTRAVFVRQTPFYTYSLTAQVEHRFCAVQLVDAGLASASEVCQAFDLKARTFSRVRAQLRNGGIAALVPQPLGRHEADETAAAKPLIRNLYQQGQSTYEIADVVGLSPRTVGRVLNKLGVPRRLPGGAGGARQAPLFAAETAVQLAPDHEEQVSPTETVATDHAEVTSPILALRPLTESPVVATSIPYAPPLQRLATTLGLVEEAPVEFQSADNVPHAGVLLGLALLGDTHLLSEARAVYGTLKNSWYGLPRSKRRGGSWTKSPSDELLRQGFDFTTYRKGPYAPLPDDQFQTVTYVGPRGESVTYELAEAVFAEPGWPTLRLMVVKKKNGEQTHIVSTGRAAWAEFGEPVEAEHVEASAAETAWWMFGRWTQENWFKYMDEQFALDDLRATRRATPKQICLRDASDRDLVTLSFDGKLFTDTVKICAYEIETRLCGLLAADFGRSEQEGRSLIRDLLQTPGDVRVTGHELTIHLEQRSAPRDTQGLPSLCAKLNALAVTLPETAYRLRFHVKPRPVGE